MIRWIVDVVLALVIILGAVAVIGGLLHFTWTAEIPFGLQVSFTGAIGAAVSFGLATVLS